MVSGRAGFELVQKALAAGVGALVAVGAPTSLAVDLAAARRASALYGFTSRGANRPIRLNGVPSGLVSVPRPTFTVCASSTPPTGTWAGRSTVRDARAPGGVRRPPAGGRGHRAGRPGRGLRRRLRPGAAAGRRGAPGRREPRPAGPVAGEGGADQRQPRLGPAPRVQLPPDRRRRRVHPHRTSPGWARRCELDDEHGPVAVYGLPYLDPHAVADPWRLPAALAPGGARRGDAPGPCRPRLAVAGHPLGGARPRVRRRRRAERLRARHQRRRGRAGAGRRLRRASTTPPSATCTARTRSPTRSATAAHRSPTPSPRPATARAPGWSSSGAGGLAHAEFVDAPVPRPLARLRGSARASCSPTRRYADARGRRGSRRPSPTRSAPRRRWSGCGAASRTRCC